MGPSTPFTEVDDFLFGRFYPELPTNQSHVTDAELTKMLLAQRREMDPKKRSRSSTTSSATSPTRRTTSTFRSGRNTSSHPPYVKGFRHHDGFGLGMRLDVHLDRQVKQYFLRRIVLA